MCAHINFGILGKTTIEQHGQRIERRIAPRLLQALAVLLVHPGQRLSFTTLESWIWDKRPPRDLATTFHSYAHRLRRVLDSLEPRPSLATVDRGLLLEVDRRKIDYFLFRDLLVKARRCRDEGDHDQAIELAESALALKRGEPLADLNTDAASAWRQAIVRNEWIPANLLLVDEQVQRERFSAALLRLDELERQYWPDVNLVKRRLRVLHAVDRHEEVTDRFLAAYRELRGACEDEAAEELRRFHDDLRKSRRYRVTVIGGPPPISVPRQLPRAISDFVGRGDLLRALDNMTGVGEGKPRPAVVVLSGLAGVGKTTTAVRWARQAARCFPAGVLFAELRGSSPAPRMEPDDVVDFFLGKIGFSGHITNPAGRAEKLRELLEERPMLIVLDDAQNSDHLQELLPTLGESTVVITSRHRLTELCVRHAVPSLSVGPLTVEEGAALLTERIGGRRPGDAGALRELAHLCGGIPLALSLVAERAARLVGAPLSSLVRQLRDPETLLSVGTDGDGPDSSLDAVFTSCYCALPPSNASLFRLLGLMPGAEFSVEAAAALTGEDVRPTRRRLDELVGAHLLEQPGEVDRYRAHDLVLGFAARLASGDSGAGQARQRLLDFYLHTAEHAYRTAFPHLLAPPISPAVSGAAPMDFETERDALRWFFTERHNLNGFLDYAVRTGNHGFAWQLPHLTAAAFERFGLHREIVIAFSRAAEAAGYEGDKRAEAVSLNDLGYFLLGQDEVDVAAAYLERALKIMSELDFPVGLLTVKVNIAQLQRKRGHLDLAVTLYGECLMAAQEIDDRTRQANIEHHLGEVCVDRRQFGAAADHFGQALAIREELGDVPAQIGSLAELCAVARADGRVTVATELAARALALLRDDLPAVPAAIRLYTVLAELRADLKDFGGAAQFARRAAELAKRAGKGDSEAVALDLLGHAHVRLGERSAACQVWRRATQIFLARGRTRRAALITEHLAEVCAAGPPSVPTAREPDDGTPEEISEGRPIG
ncbi:tetratricopeptide repeat protein [Amycolatopsis pigmentata]|uniref:Tetratricopeptide repeat protein n=1 Tax=Amycolatopsis pigmentata TaxID=450801 RepID=A0ABW5G2E0_9PSEU